MARFVLVVVFETEEDLDRAQASNAVQDRAVWSYGHATQDPDATVAILERMATATHEDDEPTIHPETDADVVWEGSIEADEDEAAQADGRPDHDTRDEEGRE